MEPPPRTSLSSAESPDDLARRLERERRATLNQREDCLGHSLAPFRVGSVPYLNAVPLTRGLEDQIIFVTPSKLAELLNRDELDAALVSVTEVLFNDRYDVLDGIAIASLGEVKSVILAHRRPLAEAKEIYCDTASLTSVNLLRVLLAEQGLHPQFKPLPSYDDATLPDFALLIGDPALDFLFTPNASSPAAPAVPPGVSPANIKAGSKPAMPREIPTPLTSHQIWDLGAAWFELTGMPFVYAVWALRRGLDTRELRRLLRAAKDFGMETLDTIIRDRPEYNPDFRRDYLNWHIHYHLCSDERRGLDKFIELLRKHGSAPVYQPKFVG